MPPSGSTRHGSDHRLLHGSPSRRIENLRRPGKSIRRSSGGIKDLLRRPRRGSPQSRLRGPLGRANPQPFLTGREGSLKRPCGLDEDTLTPMTRPWRRPSRKPKGTANRQKFVAAISCQVIFRLCRHCRLVLPPTSTGPVVPRSRSDISFGAPCAARTPIWSSLPLIPAGQPRLLVRYSLTSPIPA